MLLPTELCTLQHVTTAVTDGTQETMQPFCLLVKELNGSEFFCEYI